MKLLVKLFILTIFILNFENTFSQIKIKKGKALESSSLVVKGEALPEDKNIATNRFEQFNKERESILNNKNLFILHDQKYGCGLTNI